MTGIQRKRHVTLGVAVVIALALVLLLRQVMPEPPALAGTVPTGASFNLTLGSFQTAQEAAMVAANVQTSGLPAFTRAVRRGGSRQVIVGPFVSIDEAETAQRGLTRLGFGRPRMLVDESIRRTPGIQLASFAGGGLFATPDAPGIVMVAAAGRVSLVLELPEQPRSIATRRASGSVIEVDAGPVATPVAYQEWNAPEGVTVVNQISLGEGDAGALRARVSTPAFTQSNVRVLGRRVYIDLWSQDAKEPAIRRRSEPEAAGGLQASDEEMSVDAPPDYFTTMAPLVARVDEIKPFLMSAVQSPSPEVLAAVSKTLRSVQDRIGEVQAPAESATTHNALVEAIALAAQATEPNFEGDRVGQARQALASFDTTAATLRPPQSPAPQP